LAINLRPAQTAAATNGTINFQARLETSSGAIAPDGVYNVEFKLYSVSSSGSAQWTEDYLVGSSQGITVTNGYLTANLGSITAFPNTINWDQQEWLTMNIGGTGGSVVATATSTTGWDGEMSPRLALTGVPYAFRAGSLALLTGSNTSTLGWATQTAANSLLLPNAGGTLCIQGSASCNFAPSTNGTGYIQNQNSGAQSGANFNIDGSGTAATSFISPLFTSASALSVTSASGQNLTLSAAGTATASLEATTLNIGTSNSVHTIGIGNIGTTGTQAITIGGSGNTANTLKLEAGSGSTAILIGNDATTHGIQIGAGGTSTNVETITIGSTSSTSSALIQAGTGNLQIQTQGGTLGIGNNAIAQTLQIGNSTSGTAVNIDCGATAANCNFGTTANVHTTTIGSTNSTASTVIQGGSNGASIDSSAAVKIGNTNATSVAIGNTANSTITENVKNSSTTAYVLQTASSVSLLTADTTNSKLTVGGTSGTPILLVLANKNTAGDPTEVDGAMYYNSSTKNFRCGQSGFWTNCIGGLLSSSTAVSSTISNCGTGGTACASFSNSGVTIPANYCVPGRVIHLFASGWYYSSSGAPVLDFGVYLGSDATVAANDTIVGRTNNLGTAASQSADGWDADYYINCYTSGTSGTITFGGTVNYTKNSTNGTNSSGVIAPTSLGGTTVINTQNAYNLYLFPIFGTAAVGNSITCMVFNVYGN
jgi:hypothetical protein